MKRWIPILLLFASVGWGQSFYQNNVYTTTYINGTRVVSVIPGVGVQVCTTVSGACTPVTVYSDAGLSMPITQPLPVDGSGNFGFWTSAGTYSFRVLNGQGAQIQAYPFTVGGGGSSFTLNGLSGAVTLACTSPIVCTPSGNTITLSQGTPLSITSFTGGRAGELGQSFVNPAFAASYTGTPTSANITNTDSIDSPHNLTTPFTAATLSGTFTHSSVATTTFTLHATDGTTSPTATQTITWNPAIFGGVGTAGATSSVTASGTTAVLSTSDILPRLQLSAETVGQIFGPFTPGGGGQNVYLLLMGGSHTFVDGTGFTFPFNAPIAVTFVNEFGVTVSMFLYQSTNSLFLPVTAKVAS